MDLDNLKIDFNSMEDIDDINLIDLKDELEEKLNNLNILKEYSLNNISSSGVFKDSFWVLENELNHLYTILDFEQFKKLLFKGISQDDVLIIKCFIAKLITDNPKISPPTLRNKLKSIYILLDITSNLSEDMLEDCEGRELPQIIEEMQLSDIARNQLVYDFLEYLDFIDDLMVFNDNNKFSLYQSELKLLKKKYNVQQKSRKLPSSKDIVMLSNYIEKFFIENDDKDLETLYFPILIWWKLTNIIPMRISELCRNMTRECIMHKNERYYIKINRVKNPNNKEHSGLPILSELEISEDIYNLIEHYLNLTSFDKDSKTLFSYRAQVQSKQSLSKKDYDYDYKASLKSKNNIDYFSSTIFANLLDTFYEDVVRGRFKDSIIVEQVSPNDTRHFAFFSLLMQGLDPVEIALLGGHSNIKTQENYQNAVSYYVDSELYKLINKRLSNSSNLSQDKIRTLRDIFNQMSKEPLEPLLNYRPLEVGYCTCKFLNGESCEDFDDCCFCSKWWCYPDQDNFNKKLQMLKDKILKKSKDKLNKSIDFLELLISKSNMNIVDSKYIFNAKDKEALATTVNDIKYQASKINKIRNSLIDYEELKSIATSEEDAINIARRI